MAFIKFQVYCRNMDKVKINRFLIKTARWAGWALIPLMLLYFISGYGMTKRVIDEVLAKSLHEKWLPFPMFLAFLLHTLIYLKFALQRRIKNEGWVNTYIIVLGVVFLFLFFYLYFL